MTYRLSVQTFKYAEGTKAALHSLIDIRKVAHPSHLAQWHNYIKITGGKWREGYVINLSSETDNLFIYAAANWEVTESLIKSR